MSLKIWLKYKMISFDYKITKKVGRYWSIVSFLKWANWIGWRFCHRHGHALGLEKKAIEVKAPSL